MRQKGRISIASLAALKSAYFILSNKRIMQSVPMDQYICPIVLSTQLNPNENFVNVADIALFNACIWYKSGCLVFTQNWKCIEKN